MTVTIYQGVIVSVLTVLAYLVGHFIEAGRWEFVNSADGMTMAFLTLSMAEIFHSFNMRSRHGSIFTIKKQNIVLWGSGLLALVLTTAVIYIPFMARLFDFTPISVGEYFIAMAIAFSIIPIVELVKLCERIHHNRKKNK
jgi:Ca2+-transporting ATPase